MKFKILFLLGIILFIGQWLATGFLIEVGSIVGLGKVAPLIVQVIGAILMIYARIKHKCESCGEIWKTPMFKNQCKVCINKHTDT